MTEINCKKVLKTLILKGIHKHYKAIGVTTKPFTPSKNLK